VADDHLRRRHGDCREQAVQIVRRLRAVVRGFAELASPVAGRSYVTTVAAAASAGTIGFQYRCGAP